MIPNRYISIIEASDRYDKGIDSFYASAYIIRKKTGKLPDWYIEGEKNNAKIDVYEYERWSDLERRVWIQSTNNLYYIIAYDFGLSDTQIARFMVRHSKRFTSLSSWTMFFGSTLFSLPNDSILLKRWSMTQEFFLTASYLIKILIQEEKQKGVSNV